MESLQAQEKQKLCGGRGQYCCVPGCGSARYDSNKIKTKIDLFTFPTNNPSLMRSWVNVISNYRRKEVTITSQSPRRAQLFVNTTSKKVRYVYRLVVGVKHWLLLLYRLFFLGNAFQTTKRKSPRKRRFPENTQSETEFVPEVSEVDMEVEECCNECILHLWRWKSVAINAFFI